MSGLKVVLYGKNYEHKAIPISQVDQIVRRSFLEGIDSSEWADFDRSDVAEELRALDNES